MKIWQLCFDVNNYANLQAVPPLTADEIQSFNGTKSCQAGHQDELNRLKRIWNLEMHLGSLFRCLVRKPVMP